MRMVKIFLGVNKTASNYAAIGDIGWSSCYARQIADVYCMQATLANMDTDCITKFVYNQSQLSEQSIDYKPLWILYEYDINIDLTIYDTKAKIKEEHLWKTLMKKNSKNGSEISWETVKMKYMETNYV